MYNKTNIYTYGLSCKECLYSGLKSSSFCVISFHYARKQPYDILFTFDKLGILMQISCYHMPYVSNND